MIVTFDEKLFRFKSIAINSSPKNEKKIIISTKLRLRWNWVHARAQPMTSKFMDVHLIWLEKQPLPS